MRELLLVEAGISQPGEMERLERMIRPDVVVFTSIGDAHQEHFGSLEQKCAEKMRLADRAHTIVYHSYYEPLASMIAERFADRRLIDAARFPAPSAEVAGGAAAGHNAQIVEAFCEAMGYPAPSFRRSPSVAMRLEVKDGINESILVNDAYNLDINSLALAWTTSTRWRWGVRRRSCCRTSRRAGIRTTSCTAAWPTWSPGPGCAS